MALTRLPSSWGFWCARLGLSRSELEALSKASGREYSPYKKERPGKKYPRQIDRPVGRLAVVQGRIYRTALRDLPYPKTMHGCVPGRSLLTHVEDHIGRPCVVTLDLRNCFRSVTRDMVYLIWRESLGLAPPFANLLTRLTTWRKALPQGGATSAALANLAMHGAHTEVSHLCMRADLRISQWLDDLVLSGRDPDRAIEEVVAIFRHHGFSVNRSVTVHGVEIDSE